MTLARRLYVRDRHYSISETLEDVLKHVDSHRAYLQGLKQEGLLLAGGPLVPPWRCAAVAVPDDEAQATLTVFATTILTPGSDSRNTKLALGPCFRRRGPGPLVTTQSRHSSEKRRVLGASAQCVHNFTRRRTRADSPPTVEAVLGGQAPSSWPLWPFPRNPGRQLFLRSPHAWLIAFLLSALERRFLPRHLLRLPSLWACRDHPLGGFYLQPGMQPADDHREPAAFRAGDNVLMLLLTSFAKSLLRDSP